MAWTAEKDAALKRLWPTKSASEIGLALGTTRNAVIGRYHRLQGDYADYVSPQTKDTQAQRAAARKVRLIRESRAIEEMKKRITTGLGRNDAIMLAKESGARLRVIGQAFGISKQRINQIVGSST